VWTADCSNCFPIIEPVHNKGTLAMNQFFYETRGKEKVRELMKEGTRSQAHTRSNPNILHRLPKLIVILMVVLGVLGFLTR
jgi:hypothetical protein